ncbi:RNA polymerase sigma factor [Actinoplanes utahensis]|uniref:RNA polymerase sigma factor n=1 Tax=Actinoplanes utahensis TaxID=1869 RepID=UPI000AA385D8|nr:sigma-70 family RNA polymerase sigma factor [Actinoplanes utahensis]
MTFNAWQTASIRPHAYVRTVARRMYWQHVKEGNRRSEALQRAAVSDAGELDVYDSDARHLIEMLRRLPPAQREVMAWAIDGFAADEIAEHTGSSASTVRSNLRHAGQAPGSGVTADLSSRAG